MPIVYTVHNYLDTTEAEGTSTSLQTMQLITTMLSGNTTEELSLRNVINASARAASCINPPVYMSSRMNTVMASTMILSTLKEKFMMTNGPSDFLIESNGISFSTE
eukprot:scaffold766_cov210-Alexandrium_tamarense.AAC.4